jgi:hypothetical protein
MPRAAGYGPPPPADTVSTLVALEAPGEPEAREERVVGEADDAGDPVENRPIAAAPRKCIETSVVGVVERPEHPVAVEVERTPVWLGEPCDPVPSHPPSRTSFGAGAVQASTRSRH